MKSLSAIVASVPLILSSMTAVAGDVHFKAPATDRAAQSAELLTRAANAVDDVTRGGTLSNLWVFPTHDADTVFARYTLASPDASSSSVSTTEHLALVEQRADGTFSVKDLTEAGRNAPHWSASIGNGRTSIRTVPNSTAKAGVPGPAHWSARIGTGRPTQVAEAAPNEQRVAKLVDSHWTSKVGTARARQ